MQLNKASILVRKVIIAWKAFWIIKNWIKVLPDYFGLSRRNEILYIFWNGIKLKTRSRSKDDRAVVKGVWINKNYLLEKDDIENESTIIDLGAQLGSFSIFVASYANNVKVYSYEPCPENYKMLMDNIKLNKLDKSVFPFRMAISDRVEKIKLFIDEGSTVGHSAIIKREKYILVDAITLPEVFENNKIMKCDLLKIDIEGSEYAVLYSTPSFVFQKIERIYLEYEDIESTKDHNHVSLKGFLESHGFTITHKKPFLYGRRKMF